MSKMEKLYSVPHRNALTVFAVWIPPKVNYRRIRLSKCLANAAGTSSALMHYEFLIFALLEMKAFR